MLLPDPGVLLLTSLAALVALVPYRDLRVLGAILAWLAGSVLRVRRAHVEAALARAGVASPAAVADAMYASLGAGVMELLWLAGQPRRELAPLVAIDPGSAATLAPLLASGRGLVLGASHTGNWELAACALGTQAPLSVLVKPVSLGGFDRFMRGLRAKYGVGLLEGKGALLRARRELREGRVVAVLIDQVPPPGERAERVPFLGESARVDRRGAILAALAGVPFVVTASRRDAEGRHVLHVLSVKRPPRAAELHRAWAREATHEATDELAAFVNLYPDQWLWLHRRWKRA